MPPERKPKIIRKNNSPWTWSKFWNEVAVGVVVGLIILIVWHAASYAKDRIWPSESKDSTKKELKVDRTINFEDWKLTGQKNDLLFIDEVLSLNPSAYIKGPEKILMDPQGYIESPITMSENSFVCLKFVPMENATDLTFRSANGFALTLGDGDNKSIRLKQFSLSDPNWPTVWPDNPSQLYTDDQGRYILENPLPVGKDTTACLTINSKPGGTTRQISAELSIFGPDNKPLPMTRNPSWTMTSESQTNGSTNFSIGLIDSRGDHPQVKLEGYCAVEMAGEKPDAAETEACKNP